MHIAISSYSHCRPMCCLHIIHYNHKRPRPIYSGVEMDWHWCTEVTWQHKHSVNVPELYRNSPMLTVSGRFRVDLGHLLCHRVGNSFSPQCITLWISCAIRLFSFRLPLQIVHGEYTYKCQFWLRQRKFTKLDPIHPAGEHPWSKPVLAQITLFNAVVRWYT